MHSEFHGKCLKPCCFGFALGMATGISFFVMALVAHWYPGWGVEMINLMASFYKGYEASVMGALIGLGWGFVEGFIIGTLIAWFYNMGCCWCKMCHKKSDCGTGCHDKGGAL